LVQADAKALYKEAQNFTKALDQMVQATKGFAEAVAAATGADWPGAVKTEELCMVTPPSSDMMHACVL
jgi:hypothetical protein